MAGNRTLLERARAVTATALGITLFALLCLVDSASGYTFVRVGIASNFLFLDGKVAFIQGTGSLTVLDLTAGQVVLRKKPSEDFSYDGKLAGCDYGVLMLDYDRVALLDAETLDAVWLVEHCHDGATDDKYLVSHDGNETVRCHDLRTGHLRWTAPMQGGWNIVAAGGKAVVTTPDYYHGQAAIEIFDLETGRRLLRKEAASGEAWRSAFFDGKLLYLVTVKNDGAEGAGCERLTTLDLDGRVVDEVDYWSAPVIHAPGTAGDVAFLLAEKAFLCDGRVRRSYPWEAEAIEKACDGGRCRVDSLPSGLLSRRRVEDASGESGAVVRMCLADTSWQAYLAYVESDGDVWQVAEKDDKLLLGSDLGHVECRDLATGQPLWLYAFPPIRQTMSYSTPYGLPPYLTRRAAGYRRGVAALGEACRSALLPDDFDATRAHWTEIRAAAECPGHIVIDPEPDDPFQKLGRYLRWLAFFTLVPLVAFPLVFLLSRKPRLAADTGGPAPESRTQRRYALLAVCLLGLSVWPAAGLLLFGRVSFAWTLALKLVFALAVLLAAYAIVHLFLQRRWIVASLLTALLGAWVYFMRYPWWFA